MEFRPEGTKLFRAEGRTEIHTWQSS